MKITDIQFGMLRVPLKTPFKTALRTVEAVEDIVVMINTDTGHTGYGEAPATAVITGDTHGSIVEAIRQELVDFIAMTTRGAGGIVRTVLGRVATAVVRSSEVPVLLVTPDVPIPSHVANRAELPTK